MLNSKAVSSPLVQGRSRMYCVRAGWFSYAHSGMASSAVRECAGICVGAGVGRAGVGVVVGAGVGAPGGWIGFITVSPSSSTSPKFSSQEFNRETCSQHLAPSAGVRPASADQYTMMLLSESLPDVVTYRINLAGSAPVYRPLGTVRLPILVTRGLVYMR